MIDFLKTLKLPKLTRRQTFWLATFFVVGLVVYGLGSEYIKGQFVNRSDPEKSIRVPADSQSTSVNVEGNSNAVITNSTITTK